MKKTIYITAACVLLTAYSSSAQEDSRKERKAFPADREVKTANHSSVKEPQRIDIRFDLDYGRLALDRNDQLEVTPYILSAKDKGDTIKFAPVLFLGDTRYRELKRIHRLEGISDDDTFYDTVIMSKREIRQRRRAIKAGEETLPNSLINYNISLPYSRQLDGSAVMVGHYYGNCCENYAGPDGYVGPVFEPVKPKVSFIEPPYEVEKARSESMTSRVTFEVAKHNIKREFGNNAQELDQLYDFLDNILGNENLRVSSMHLKGYASPEGSYPSNTKLADNRVRAFADLIMSRYSQLDAGLFKLESEPEDWDSLRKWVAASDLQYRQEIVAIIDNTSDPDARDGQIRALDKSVTYTQLLKEVYPGLRRTDHKVDYVVMPFTVEKGKEVIKTNPAHLSLHELYQIAETYPVGSPEYKETFEVAARFFPDDPATNNNMAALAMLEGDFEKAKRYLSRIPDYEGAQNNLGILYALDDDYAKAESAFRRAVAAGNGEAAFNSQNVRALRFD